MNNQIRELAKQALQKCMDENGFLNNTNWRINADHYAESEVFEKFAELIVEECLEIVGNNNPCPPGTTIIYSLLQDEYFDKGWQVAVETKSNQIKKHFGVEE